MSSPNLVSFITKLNDELMNFSEYRSTLNSEPQTFVFNKRTLLSETLKQLKAKNVNNVEITSEMSAQIKIITDKYGDKLISELEALAGRKISRPGGRLEMVFDKNTAVDIPEHYVYPVSNYTKIRLTYKNILNDMFKELQDYLVKTDFGIIKNKDGSEKQSILGFYDTGHEDKAGVFERFLSEKTEEIAKSLNANIDSESDALLKEVQKTLSEKGGFTFSIKKIDKESTIFLKVESSALNRSRGAKSGDFSKKLRAQINKFLAREDLADLKGSDSFKAQKRKNILKDTKKQFENIPGVTTSFEDTKIKQSSTKAETLRVKPKVSKQSNPKVQAKGTKPARGKRVKRDSASSMLQLVQQLNAKLPEAITNNMRAPRLQNRTGRFASSVKIVDVTQTRQGYKSFGYTYQTGPYQTFEPGYAQGSVERDPRRLIDRSIREIAAEMALGRFYTRRL